ncbi:MAG TPA: hypothetical protein VHQ86_04995 [Candidatus Saccharimonadia bacterium]|jgi:hypothetical protein|nr:hypothetical protein [Candidatus Saccharimonadia bacterium]
MGTTPNPDPDRIGQRTYPALAIYVTRSNLLVICVVDVVLDESDEDENGSAGAEEVRRV